MVGIKVVLTEKDGDILNKALCDKFEWFSERWKMTGFATSVSSGHKVTLSFEIDDNNGNPTVKPDSPKRIVEKPTKSQKKVMGRPPALDDELKEYIRQNKELPPKQIKNLIKEVYDKKVSLSTVKRIKYEQSFHHPIIEFLGEKGSCSTARIQKRFPESNMQKLGYILKQLKSDGDVVYEGGLWSLASESEQEPEDASLEWGG